MRTRLFSQLWPWLTSLLLAASLTLSLDGCQKSSPAPTPTPAPSVQVGNVSGVGPVLTDSVGNTLYVFSTDVDGANTCTSSTCNSAWPLYYGGTIRVPAGLSASDFSSKKTIDGRWQTYYRGWPLYYHAPLASNGSYVREPAGQASGNGIGGVWFALNPSFGVMVARKSVLDKTTNVSTTKTYLVDVQGRTLYYYAKDDAFPNTLPTNCTSGCLTAWPALLMSVPAAPSSLQSSDFGTITRPDAPAGNSQQLTYKGRPLYYFVADNATRGHVEGEHLNSFGDYWYVVTP